VSISLDLKIDLKSYSPDGLLKHRDDFCVQKIEEAKFQSQKSLPLLLSRKSSLDTILASTFLKPSALRMTISHSLTRELGCP
jgi:hypothetical protein